MQAQFWATIISAFSFLITVLVALFLIGGKWAKLGVSVNSIDKRLQRIEGLFRLSLREDQRD